MADSYSLRVENNSHNAGVVCVFQQQPNLGPNVLPMAWFTKYTYPTTVETFYWNVEYGFCWDETGVLAPGIVFTAAQTWAADLSFHNMVTLTYDGKYDGALTFEDVTRDARNPGALHIHEDSTIPPNLASVGVTMSGRGLFAVQAQPNMDVFFVPHPTYWICFGSFRQGEVLDIDSLTALAELPFSGARNLSAVLGPLNTWTITTLP